MDQDVFSRAKAHFFGLPAVAAVGHTEDEIIVRVTGPVPASPEYPLFFEGIPVHYTVYGLSRPVETVRSDLVE
jgi:hypothetical protein